MNSVYSKKKSTITYRLPKRRVGGVGN